MSLQQNLLKKLQEFLKPYAVVSTVPLSILLIGLEAIMDRHFTCPCRSDLNALLTASIFTGPVLFTFALMFYQLRPLKHGWVHCPQTANHDTQQSCFKLFASCLIPPVMWVFILLLDGDYVACSMTDWKGIYVLDKELNWCKPTEEKQNENELQDLTRKFIHQSQFSGYVVISVFSVLAIVIVGIYDCCISGKCKWCPRELSCCCRQTMETQSEEQNSGADSMRLNAVHSTIQNQAVVPPSQEDIQNI